MARECSGNCKSADLRGERMDEAAAAGVLSERGAACDGHGVGGRAVEGRRRVEEEAGNVGGESTSADGISAKHVQEVVLGASKVALGSVRDRLGRGECREGPCSAGMCSCGGRSIVGEGLRKLLSEEVDALVDDRRRCPLYYV